jgi:hypothetical protein
MDESRRTSIKKPDNRSDFTRPGNRCLPRLRACDIFVYDFINCLFYRSVERLSGKDQNESKSTHNHRVFDCIIDRFGVSLTPQEVYVSKPAAHISQ